jgi:hypothetical protein
VGLGESLDAAFTLRASVPAGSYHVTCDGIITESVDATFTLIWRRGSTDTILAEWSKHWDPLPSGFKAQPYEIDVEAPAIDWKSGDQLVFRYHGQSAKLGQAFIPNGDGERNDGRLPNIRLPQ